MQALYDLMDTMLPFTWMQPDFMKNALLAVLLITPTCAMMGVKVVNFRMAFFTDAVSHSAFTGVALGVLFHVDPVITLIIFGFLIGLAIIHVKRRSQLNIDTIIGVFMAFCVSLGIAIISARRGLNKSLHSFLYGEIITINETELLFMLLLLITVLIYMVIAFNRLLLLGLNEPLARAQGVKAALFDYSQALLLALVVSIGIRSIGILLITAMLIVPAAAGRNLARSASGMFWNSIIIALASGIAGLILSFYLDTAVGATIILVGSAFFFITHLINLLRG